MRFSPIDLTVPPLSELQQCRSGKWAPFDPGVLSLTIAEMDFPILPEVAQALTATIKRSDLGYGVPAPRRLCDALAGFAARRLNWRLDPEQVTVVPDVMLGIVDLCRAIATPGGAVGFATPAYPPFFREPALAGLRTMPIGLSPDGSIDLDELDEALRAGVRVLVLSNPHNPTGRMLTLAELTAIAERCAEHEVWVLADEIHAALVFPGEAHVPWFEVSDAARRWGIVLTSASKAFNLSALKTAFLVSADPAGRSLVQALGPQHDHASLLGEIAAEVAFRDGDRWLDAVLDRLARNHDHLRAELHECLPDILWQPPRATYFAWLDCRGLNLENEPADVFLQRGRLALGPGLNYGQPGAGHVRLNFATGPEHLTEAVTRMTTALRR